MSSRYFNTSCASSINILVNLKKFKFQNEKFKKSERIRDVPQQQKDDTFTDILKIYQRNSSVPELLKQQGVSKELWWKTYLAVTEYCRTALLQYALIQRDQAKLVKAWNNLVSALQAKYGPLGIQLTLVRAASGTIVGIGFEVSATALAKEEEDESESLTSIESGSDSEC